LTKVISKLSIAVTMSLYFFLVVAVREPSAAQSSGGGKVFRTHHEAFMVKPPGDRAESSTPASELGAKLYSGINAATECGIATRLQSSRVLSESIKMLKDCP
jgi:hypothetical protein